MTKDQFYKLLDGVEWDQSFGKIRTLEGCECPIVYVANDILRRHHQPNRFLNDDPIGAAMSLSLAIKDARAIVHASDNWRPPRGSVLQEERKTLLEACGLP